MANYSIELTLIAIIISLIPRISTIISGRKISYADNNLSEKNSVYMAVIKDIFSGFSIIKSFKAEVAFNSIHNKQCEKVK